MVTPIVPDDVASFLKSAEESIVIGGQRRPALSGRTLQSIDPGTGRALANIACGDAMIHEHA